jgi:dTDP-4-amino-4,6-dideoxygalactose transaminase
MVVFSFHPVKSLTTGEGGMILTNNEELYEKLLYLRTHGITRESKFMEGNSDGPWYYQQIDLGMNYRITDIQASLGISQLTHLDEFISRRYELAKRYNEALSDLPITTPYMHPGTYSAFHLYVIRLKLNEIKKTRKEVFELLRDKEIGVNVHYIPVHIQPYYKKQGFGYGQYPEAENYYEQTISLPLYPSMNKEDQNYVIQSLKEILN